jgi:23S rRNA (uracil1939-C5)-methyltransferase
MKHQRPTHAPGERFEGIVDRIVPGGLGLVHGPRGFVLVERAAPGDRAVFEIESIRSGVPRGSIVTMLDPGPGRIEAPCPWYGRCGGCDFQHLTYAAQVDAKRQIVLDALGRIGGIEPPTEIGVHPAPRHFGSRARIELHSDRDRQEIGFYERQSRNVVPIDHCMISREEVDSALQAIRRSTQPFPASIHVLGGNREVRSHPAFPPVEGGSFWLRVGEFDYLVDPGSFFQSSLDLLPDLIEWVTGSEVPGELAWDLYCGAGLFSLPLARRFQHVHGVDFDARTIGNAGKCAERNGAGNVSFSAADVFAWASGRKRANVRPDLVVVDPPRAGLDRRLTQLLANRGIRRLTYVSCDPATLARDLRILTSNSLRLVDVAIFDLFPQTHHIETVARLSAD